MGEVRKAYKGKYPLPSIWRRNWALEVVAMGKSLRVVRAPRPLKYLDYDRTGFADADYGPIK